MLLSLLGDEHHCELSYQAVEAGVLEVGGNSFGVHGLSFKAVKEGIQQIPPHAIPVYAHGVISWPAKDEDWLACRSVHPHAPLAMFVVTETDATATAELSFQRRAISAEMWPTIYIRH
jgi:hypothetical protein